MGKKIMVVDDEPDTLELAKAILEMNNFEAVVIDTAQKALDSLQTEKPDLVLLDMRMPQISGPDFCKKIKEKGLKFKIVFFTASSNEDAALLKESGAMGYIFKPFDNDELVKQINSYLK